MTLDLQIIKIIALQKVNDFLKGSGEYEHAEFLFVYRATKCYKFLLNEG